MLRYLTAGESHGPKLTGIVEGLPSGLTLSKLEIDRALQDRQKGPGRGGRMKIEQDEVVITAGVRGEVTTGAPVALEVRNRDWANWESVMTSGKDVDWESKKVIAPRPGHADLTGTLKYRMEIRNVLERASARETAIRVAVGNLSRQLLTDLGVEIRGRVISVGAVDLQWKNTAQEWERVFQSEWKVGDVEGEQRLNEQLSEARRLGESLGGILEIQVLNLPAGLGSYVQWDRKLDGRLAHAILSVQAMKGVSFGLGFETAKRFGSEVHDPIVYHSGEGYKRNQNNAGGIEGGMTNGEPVIVQVAMKPIPTLYHPLQTVNLETKAEVQASIERSDICAVPAALTVLEHVIAWEIAQAVLEKFPSDTMYELKRAWQEYLEYLKAQ
ncbi:chorismate synthase [Desulfitobacterium metallireducens]|uniref:Chorismate synthase n=1 Tax=Desulfitobacterium metallireducens DSM 15288 TaxID=871968 RepID=W0ED22_9FIRM|nr:chorismate synthase [Desulfitobacterium metallireducens]AHF07428.1 chorismate synthase [Desulfitobacterium metallireducens DSM 15288]